MEPERKFITVINEKYFIVYKSFVKEMFEWSVFNSNFLHNIN